MPTRLASHAVVLVAVLALGATAACSDDDTAQSTSTGSGDGGRGGQGGGAGDGGGAQQSTGEGTPSSSTAATSTADATATSSSVSSGASSSSSSSGSGGSGGGFASCAIGLDPGQPGGGAPGGRVRVVAANLSTGNNQAYDSGHGVRILQGLDADIILMQEMNRGSNNTGSINLLVEEVCDGECSYIRGPQAQIPNGVLSRLPILDCGFWEDPEVDNRNFVWARIDVPGDADLWAISVHLLTESASRRDDEIEALLGEIQGAIPATDLIVLGGDLNTNSRNESGIDKLDSLFETGGPYPEDHDGEDGTNAPRDKPYDWVIASSELFPLEIPVEIGASVFAAGAVIDTRVYEPLSEIAPAQAGDSAADGMQHMAVVKDFLFTAQ